MAIYKHRRSFDSDATQPAMRELEVGEIAINIPNRTLWTKDDNGDVVLLTRTDAEVRTIIQGVNVSDSDIVDFRIDSDNVRSVVFIDRAGNEVRTTIGTTGITADPSEDTDYVNLGTLNRRLTAIQAGDISNLTDRLESEIDRLDSELAAEIVDRAREDSELEARIDARIDSENTNRAREDSELNTRVTNIISGDFADRDSEFSSALNDIHNLNTIVEVLDDARDRILTLESEVTSPVGQLRRIDDLERQITSNDSDISTIRDDILEVVRARIESDQRIKARLDSDIRRLDSEINNIDVTSDIRGNRQFIFTPDGNMRTLTEFRESDEVFRVRDGLEVQLVTLTPRFATRGIGSNLLTWDTPATGSLFVGIEVDITGDIELTNDATDPYISSIRGVGNINGGILTFNLLDQTRGSGGTPAASNSQYTLRAVVDNDSFFRPSSTTAADLGVGGTISGDVTFNQRVGTGTISQYTGTINDASWSITWQNVSTSLTNSGYRESSSNRNFLQTYTFRPISYSNGQAGLANPGNTVQSIAMSTTTPTSYITLSNATGNGNVEFTSPVHKDTARNVTVNSITSLRRPQEVTGTQYDISLAASTSISAPTFQYPGFYILTNLGDTPSREDIIDDGTASGFSGNVTVLADGFTGTGSNGEMAIEVTNAPALTVWFGIRRSASQPTNFEVHTGFAFSDINSRVTGINPAVTVELEPDTPPADWRNGEDYRLYGFQVENGMTRVRIY